jgi:hypothetical protein
LGGRKKSAEFIRAIEERGGIEWIAAAVERGRSRRAIAAEIGCGRWWLDRWIYADPSRTASVRRSALRARACGARVQESRRNAGHGSPNGRQTGYPTDGGELERRAQELGDGMTALDYVYDYLAEGQT